MNDTLEITGLAPLVTTDEDEDPQLTLQFKVKSRTATAHYTVTGRG